MVWTCVGAIIMIPVCRWQDCLHGEECTWQLWQTGFDTVGGCSQGCKHAWEAKCMQAASLIYRPQPNSSGHGVIPSRRCWLASCSYATGALIPTYRQSRRMVSLYRGCNVSLPLVNVHRTRTCTCSSALVSPSLFLSRPIERGLTDDRPSFSLYVVCSIVQ